MRNRPPDVCPLAHAERAVVATCLGATVVDETAPIVGDAERIVPSILDVHRQLSGVCAYGVQNRFLSMRSKWSLIVGAGFGASVTRRLKTMRSQPFIADLLEPGDGIVLVRIDDPRVPDHLARL
jgi:hypothetical protein